MSKIEDFPTPGNSILKAREVNARPIFVNKTVAGEMFGVSKSTIYKWCQEAEDSKEWRHMSIRPSATVTLIHVETMEKFLRSKNKDFL